jgi:TPR repeat protein
MLNLGLKQWIACALVAFFALALLGCGGSDSAQRAYDDGRYEVAFSRWERLAQFGDAKAQNQIGWMYERGIGTDRDLNEAIVWYRKAAQSGFATAQTNLGLMYLNGLGIERNAQEARRWFEKAAAQGDAKAENNLGVLFDQGRGVPENNAKAAEYFSRAAARGNLEAKNNLGVLYRFGRGVDQDPAKARELFEDSANGRFAEAANNLGLMWERGELGELGEPNHAKALHYFEAAAATGHATAAINASTLLMAGKGIKPDRVRAYAWLNVAAATGNRGALKRKSEIAATMTRDEVSAAQLISQGLIKNH